MQSPIFFLPIFDGVWDLAFSPDGKQLATCDRNGTVSLWEVAEIIRNDSRNP